MCVRVCMLNICITYIYIHTCNLYTRIHTRTQQSKKTWEVLLLSANTVLQPIQCASDIPLRGESWPRKSDRLEVLETPS